MKINVDKEYRNLFNNTGTYLTEYILFVNAEDQSIKWEKKKIMVLIDNDESCYALKKYGEENYAIIDLAKKREHWSINPVLNTPYVADLNGKYDGRNGIEVTMYGSYSEESCKKLMLSKLQKFVKEKRWVTDVDLQKIVEVMK